MPRENPINNCFSCYVYILIQYPQLYHVIFKFLIDSQIKRLKFPSAMSWYELQDGIFFILFNLFIPYLNMNWILIKYQYEKIFLFNVIPYFINPFLEDTLIYPSALLAVTKDFSIITVIVVLIKLLFCQ